MSTSHVRPSVRFVPVYLGLATGLAVLAGCASGQTTSPPHETHSATSTPSADPRTAVEDAYDRYWSVSSTEINRPESEWQTSLSAVAAEPQLSRILEGYRYLQAQKTTLYGTVTDHVTAVRINGDQATVTDCQDASRSGQADAATGKARNVGIARNPVSGSMAKGSDRVWRVIGISYPGGTC